MADALSISKDLLELGKSILEAIEQVSNSCNESNKTDLTICSSQLKENREDICELARALVKDTVELMSIRKHYTGDYPELDGFLKALIKCAVTPSRADLFHRLTFRSIIKRTQINSRGV